MCPVNRKKGFFSIGVLDNNNHHPTSVIGLFKKEALVFLFPKKRMKEQAGTLQALSPNSRSSKSNLPHNYAVVQVVKCLSPKSKIDFPESEINFEVERTLQIDRLMQYFLSCKKKCSEKGITSTGQNILHLFPAHPTTNLQYLTSCHTLFSFRRPR